MHRRCPVVVGRGADDGAVVDAAGALDAPGQEQREKAVWVEHSGAERVIGVTCNLQGRVAVLVLDRRVGTVANEELDDGRVAIFACSCFVKSRAATFLFLMVGRSHGHVQEQQLHRLCMSEGSCIHQCRAAVGTDEVCLSSVAEEELHRVCVALCSCGE